MNQRLTKHRKQEQPTWKSDSQRWEAVLRRDFKAEGAFFYGVKSTGIYCRPSCSARRALRKNVVFFDSAEQAAKAGFRPCLRCHPEGTHGKDPREAAIERACKALADPEASPSFATLAKDAGMSPYHFHRLFKRLVGLTPKRYANAHRARRLRTELARTTTVTEAFYRAGYNASSRFYASARQALGMLPSRFRSGAPGETIRFAVGQCSLGAVLVAATGKGICAIELGDDPDALARAFQDRFSKAHLLGDDPQFEQLVARVVGWIDVPEKNWDLPLDVRGTAFQQKVWEALRRIPAGTTASYSEIASKIGLPNAVRAVGRACGANPLAVVIPCHRVRRVDGNLSGYRWGVERKRTLLQRESAQMKARSMITRQNLR